MMQVRSPLTTLPAELQLAILSALSPEDIMSLARSCQSLNRVAHDEILWRTKFKKLETFASNTFA